MPTPACLPAAIQPPRARSALGGARGLAWGAYAALLRAARRAEIGAARRLKEALEDASSGAPGGLAGWLAGWLDAG